MKDLDKEPDKSNIPEKKRRVLGEIDILISSMNLSICCYREELAAAEKKLDQIKMLCQYIME